MKKVVSDREKFAWNILGSLSSAISSLVLSICVNRILGGENGGIFAFAYSNAQLMMTVGQFEVRPFQSTDIDEKYNFNTYFSLRVISCIFMLAISIIYVCISKFSFEKSIIVLAIVFFRAVEGFADVFAGRFQQKDRIDLAGKLLFVRVTFSTIGFVCILAVTHNLPIASIIMFTISLVLLFCYDYRNVFIDDKKNLAIELEDIWNLIKDVLPLFISIFITMYISNAPKYAINGMFSDEIQNIYNILFMPAFVINMFSLFVFRPLLVHMTRYWNECQLKKLWGIVGKICIFICGITGITLVGTWLFGVPVLSLIYGIELEAYKRDLMLVMTVGGVSALMTLLYYVVTIMRQQKLLLFAHLAVFAYSCIVVRELVKRMEVRGAILSYGTSVGILALSFLIIMLYTSKVRKKS